jgi:hypothetical protein
MEHTGVWLTSALNVGGMMRGKFWLLVSILLAIAYLVHILWAKFSRVAGSVVGPPPIKLGEVGEFWFFFAIILAFALQVIVEENRKIRSQSAGHQRHPQ